MARNSEKANAMLNKWLRMKENVTRGGVARKPRDIMECTDIREAEKWRGHVIRDVTRKISEIQNAGLGEHRIRDLNDEINRLLREKHKWEERIVGLGGADYKFNASRVEDAYGAELSGQGGYKYFGAAKDLPGVRELFEREVPAAAPHMTRANLLKSITPDYYGWRDEEDPELLLMEQQREEEWQKEFVEEWRKREAKQVERLENAMQSDKLDGAMQADHKKDSTGYKVYVEVPTSDDIKEMILQKKKEALLSKYVSTNEQKRVQETKQLVG